MAGREVVCISDDDEDETPSKKLKTSYDIENSTVIIVGGTSQDKEEGMAMQPVDESATLTWAMDPMSCMNEIISEVNEDGETENITINGVVSDNEVEAESPNAEVDDEFRDLVDYDYSESNGSQMSDPMAKSLPINETSSCSESGVILQDLPRPLGCKHQCCLTYMLTKSRFTSNAWTKSQRQRVIEHGRDTCFLETINITESHYQEYPWLTGCARVQKAFCWPCLLFGYVLNWTVDRNTRSMLMDSAKVHADKVSHRASAQCLLEWNGNHEDVKEFVREVRKKISLKDKCEKKRISTLRAKQRVKGSVRSLIKELIDNPITEVYWTEEDRKRVIQNGRVIPKVSPETHGIDPADFEKNPWLTGCTEIKRIFCWPCLLFSKREGNWAKFGYHFIRTANLSRHHEFSPEHIVASLQLKLWESKYKIQPKLAPVKDIDRVKTNRRFLKHIINAVCLLKKRVNNVYQSWEDFIDLVKLTVPHDLKLRHKIEHGSRAEEGKDVVSELVRTHIDGVVEAISAVMRRRIKNETDNTSYIAMFIEDPSNIVAKSSAAIIIRYADKKGSIHERFHCFIKLNYERSAGDLLDLVSAATAELNLREKLIGFTHDGVVLPAHHVPNFHFRMLNSYSLSTFFHYPEHDLRKLILQSLSHNCDHRNFFWNLSEISKFLECSPNAMSFLKAENEIDPLGWAQLDTSAGHVAAIQAFYPAMIKLFEVITACPENWESDALLKAPHFLRFLQDDDNRFMIVLIARIFSEIKELTTLLQTDWDVNAWIQCSADTVHKLGRFKNENYADVFKTAQNPSLHSEVDPLFSFMAKESTTDEDLNPMYKETFNNVINSVSNFIVQRTKDLENLEYFDLLKADSQKNIRELLRTKINSSPLFDIENLSQQLIFLNKSGLLKSKPPSELIIYINELEMTTSLSDVHKLLQLVITLPMLNKPVRHPAVKRVATYVKNNKTLETSDAFFFMEKDLLTEMQGESTFHDEVIEAYAEKIGAVDEFVYKKRI